MKNEESPQDFMVYHEIKFTLVVVSQGEETKEGHKNLLNEIFVENFPNLRRVMDINIHGSQKNSNRFNL
jgi:hypothetical protein